jgi:hypothetical protein
MHQGAFKLIKLLLWVSQFPRFRNRHYQSQEYSGKQKINALNDMNNHKPNAFKPFKPLLWALHFPRFRNRGYQSQEYSRKQEGTYLQL